MLTLTVSMPTFIVGIYRLNWFEKFLKPIYVEYKYPNLGIQNFAIARVNPDTNV